MKQFSAEVEINGSAEDAWKILTNAASYADWDPNMNSIDGTIGLGEKLVLHTTLSKRPFKVTVKELEPNSRMVWSSGMPLGLFRGDRTFQLTERGDTVHVRVHEVFKGPLSPLIGRMIPDLNPSFQKFVQALKAEVEEAKAEPSETTEDSGTSE